MHFFGLFPHYTLSVLFLVVRNYPNGFVSTIFDAFYCPNARKTQVESEVLWKMAYSSLTLLNVEKEREKGTPKM